MRSSSNSTGFVFLSLILHGLAAAALMFMPTRTVSPDKVGENNIEVNIGAPADKAGVAEAPEVKAPPKPETVAKKPEEPKAAPVAAVVPPTPKPHKIAKPHKAAVVAQAEVKPEAKSVEADDQGTVPVAAAAAAAEPKEELVPVKETPPAGVEAATNSDNATDNETEAKSEDLQKTADPAPVATADKPADGAKELPKGGADKEAAVSYLDLRQAPGNKPPQYPMQARLEKRQGSLELVYRVTKEGKVADVQVSKSSGQSDLDKAAVKAISQYRFVPGQEGWARHPVNFTLKGDVVSLPSKLRAKGAQNDD